MIMLKWIKNFKKCSQEIKSTFSGLLAYGVSGFQVSWSAPAMKYFSETKSDSHPVSHIVSSLLYGFFLGPVLTTLLLNNFGRKFTHLLALIVQIFSVIFILIYCQTDRIELIYASRFLTGIASSMTFSAVTIYIGEIASDSFRGTLSALCQSVFSFGFLAQFIVFPYFGIEISAICGLLLGFLCFISYFWMHESPLYLLKQHQKDKAFNVVACLRKNENVFEEFQKCELDFKQNTTGVSEWKNICVNSHNRKAIAIILGLITIDAGCCSDMILQYAHLLFDFVNPELPINELAISMILIMCFGTLFSPFFIKCFGKRRLFVFGLGCYLFCAINIAIYFTLKQFKFNVISWSAWPAICLVLAKGIGKFSYSILIPIYCSELLPLNIKPIGQLLIYNYLSFITIVVNHICIFTVYNYGLYILVDFLCLVIFLSMLYVWVLPETDGHSLYKIQLILMGKNYQTLPESHDNTLIESIYI